MSRLAGDRTAVPGSGDHVVVVGLGVSGEATARHLLRRGASVTIVDDGDDPVLRDRAASLADARVFLGAASDPGLAAGAAVVVASPGVPQGAPILTVARNEGVPVWSEVELAYRVSRTPILGVTGTNGKTTTTRMLAEALGEAGFAATAAGNIGRPLLDAVVEEHDVVVAELSSFQLRHIVAFRAPVGVLLNIAADHLDWHGDFDAYVAAKARLFENQRADDVAVYHNDPVCERAATTQGRRIAFDETTLPVGVGAAGLADGWIVVPEGRVVEVSSLRSRGAPIRANAVAAAAAACAFGAAPEPVGRALAAFVPLPHRMELVAEINGVAYVNDSKATNPHAVLAALEGLGNVVLIAGGRNKGLDLGAIAHGASGVTHVVAIGESATEIVEAFTAVSIPAERARSMDDAVARASEHAGQGTTVLLSPGCASFDMFADYKARGEAFRAAVKRLETSASTGEGIA